MANQAPQYAFVARDFSLEQVYITGFGVQELLTVNSVGIVTARDALTIDMDRDELWKRVEDFTRLEAEMLRSKYDLGEDVRDWRVQWAKDDITNNFSQDNLVRIAYRPFDARWTYFTGNSRGFLCFLRKEVMQNFAGKNSIGFCISKQQKASTAFFHIFAQDSISESCLTSNRTAEIGTSFPLYLYPAESELDQTRRVNMDPKIRRAIEEAAMGSSAGGTPPSVGVADISPAGGEIGARPDEVAIFDYIYGVLHCPQYRETYREFLKIDFPRVPYPPSPEIFWDVSQKGTALRRLHLMEDAVIGAAPFKFGGQGDSIVGKVEFKQGGETGSVFINESQYFEDVPLIAWKFYIGGYQPAQKWLKDRKGRALSFDDIRHYQKIIRILSETDRIMKTIEMPLA